MRKQITKALAIAMSAALLLQPISAFAEEDHNEAIVEAIETAEEEIKEALPPDPEVPQLTDEPAAEPVIAQEPTDTHLRNAEAAVETIDANIEAYNNILDATADKIDEANQEYKEAVATAAQSEAVFEQAAGAAAQAADASTGRFYFDGQSFAEVMEATVDRVQVEALAAEVYETQAEAEAAKAQAEAIANDAKQAAEDAAQLAENLQTKIAEAEAAQNQANEDYNTAKQAYDDAKAARKAAEDKYNAIVQRYGIDSANYDPEAEHEWGGHYGKNEVRTAIREAKAALKSAEDIESAALQDYSDKQSAYETAKETYGIAIEDAEDANNKLEEANAAYLAAEKAYAKASFIASVVETEANEIDIFNAIHNNNGNGNGGGPAHPGPGPVGPGTAPGQEKPKNYTQKDLDDADEALAKGLIKYYLYDEADDASKINVTKAGNKYTATYSKTVDGQVVNYSREFEIDVRNEANIHGLAISNHWLAITEEKEEPVNLYEYYYRIGYRVVEKPYGYEIQKKKDGPGNSYESFKKVYVGFDENGNRYCYEKVMADVYTEAEFYNANKDFTDDAAEEAYNTAKDNKDNLADLIEKMNDADNAATASAEASAKFKEVNDAYEAVIAAAKALKDLEKVEHVSSRDLNEARANYRRYASALNAAKFDYIWAATCAGQAKREALRALEALNGGFEYLIPTPTPQPNPNPNPNPGPSGEPSEETPYVAPVAVATPAAPAVAEAPAAPQGAVLGETRSRGGAAVEEATGDGEEKIEDGEGEKKIEEEEKKDEAVKPAVTINDEDTARAAAPIAEKKGFPWWILIILAIIVAVSIEEYNRRKNKEENIQE